MKFSTVAILLSLASTSVAYPFMGTPGAPRHYQEWSKENEKRQLGFNADAQRIDVSGDHAFKPPGAGDLRGPCPGLNALANHGYLPSSGEISLDQAVSACNKVFGMGIDLGTFLSAYATVILGNPLSLSWSIGGQKAGLNLLGLLSPPQGLSGSHNKYESDASPGRFDAFLNGGNPAELSVQNFENLYALQPGETGGNYDLGVLIDHSRRTIQESRANNPQRFSGPFTGPIVSSAAHTFIPAFMSNHSAERPEGFLDQDVLKSFFGVTGTQGNIQSQRGHERIPENWYRRPIGDEYTIPAFTLEAVELQLAVPERVAVGGNLGTVNSFTGVNLADLTGGVYNSQTLLQGNNLICFGYQTLLTVVPDVLKGLVGDVSSALNVLTSRVAPSFAQFNCPQIEYYNKDLFNKFPGAGAGL
ncbi:hypothetical protein FFLO_00445 [Filobasidium floriforme]|uniref:Heme haloperoxidase family profile domain-containing protein n=1 Tax=Filobasidium floriforme TaxID=5210 RepID=A0A8K0JRF8_9TREE|nr:hypothetical protein FFLO_00445 [Filobasidium floriforme]